MLVSASSLKVLYDEKKITDFTNDWENYSKSFTYVLLRPGKIESDLTSALASLVSIKYKAVEHFENIAQVLGCNAVSIVAHTYSHLLRFELHPYFNERIICGRIVIFEGIGYEVIQNDDQTS